MATAQKNAQHQEPTSMGDQAKDMAGDLVNKTRDAGAALAQKAGEASSFIGKKADDATAALGAGMKSVANVIRDKAPEKGVIGSASSAVADTLEQGGRYLNEQGLGGIATDMTNVIRRNPIPAVLVSIGIGFLVARALSPRA